MKPKFYILFFLSIAILAFPSVGATHTQESVIDEVETVEECERISEARTVRFQAHNPQPRSQQTSYNAYPPEGGAAVHLKPLITVPKRYIVNRVLRI